MEAQAIHLDRAKAKELYREYRKHQHYSTPMDQEIMRAYQLLAQGRLVIKALESIKLAGLNDEGQPKLAIARADAKACHLALRRDGSATMASDDTWHRRNNAAPSKWVDFPAGSFSGMKADRYEALMPSIPLHLRPKRGLQNYHVLWEAEWTKIPPRDPYLLRRIGIGDMWLVVAMWDLTEVERMALAARIN